MEGIRIAFISSVDDGTGRVRRLLLKCVFELCLSVKTLEARGIHDQLRLLVSWDRGESDAAARGASTSATVVVAPQQ